MQTRYPLLLSLWDGFGHCLPGIIHSIDRSLDQLWCDSLPTLILPGSEVATTVRRLQSEDAAVLKTTQHGKARSEGEVLHVINDGSRMPPSMKALVKSRVNK